MKKIFHNYESMKLWKDVTNMKTMVFFEVAVLDPMSLIKTKKECGLHIDMQEKFIEEAVKECLSLFIEGISVEITIYEEENVLKRVKSRRITYENDFKENYTQIRKRIYNPNSGFFQLNGTIAAGEKIDNPLEKLYMGSIKEVQEVFAKYEKEWLMNKPIY